MDVNIDETWNDHTIGTFNYGKAFLGKGGGNGNNAALVNGHIHLAKSTAVENGTAGQQQAHGVSPSFCVFVQHIIISKGLPLVNGCSPGRTDKKKGKCTLIFGPEQRPGSVCAASGAPIPRRRWGCLAEVCGGRFHMLSAASAKRRRFWGREKRSAQQWWPQVCPSPWPPQEWPSSW